ncbi:MAG: M14 family metallopeptidase [Gammaproteobacteria bacterium]|nr:M14 family metallopeptidase [Gammaproteobacteria bacterium]
MKLRISETLPDGFLDAEAHSLAEVLEGPTLIHLPGRREPPLFCAVLLHGNETTGLSAIQSVLRKYQSMELPRALSILVGNVAAAREKRRVLVDGVDYNRVWGPADAAGGGLAGQVMAQMQTRGVFACVDVHNNTGLNPHYAIVNKLDPRHLKLANMFSRQVVYSLRPVTTCSVAFAGVCPAVTIECGLPGASFGIEHAAEYIDACLHQAEIPDGPAPRNDLDLFHSVAIVRVPGTVSFRVGQPGADLELAEDLDHMNFRELAPGTVLARCHGQPSLCLEVTNEDGEDVANDYFERHRDEIRTRVPVMPAMLTASEDVIRVDCLCYLMERVDPGSFGAQGL